jgi:ectoine hydroxylase-related dioxygenase (phytanoyl-CoA dioxygenase family)
MKYEPETWIRDYQEDGYVIIRDLIDSKLLAALCDGMEKIMREADRLPSRLRQEIFFERDHVKNNPQWYPDLTPEQCGRGSQQVSDEEARQPRWRSVEESSLNFADKVKVCCPAGSGVFFSPKVIHAAGHNRSDHPRRTLNAIWTGPDTLPTSSARQLYEGLKPRSRNPACGEQLRVAFPKLFALRK